jgi:hypothetical protein
MQILKKKKVDSNYLSDKFLRRLSRKFSQDDFKNDDGIATGIFAVN